VAFELLFLRSYLRAANGAKWKLSNEIPLSRNLNTHENHSSQGYEEIPEEYKSDTSQKYRPRQKVSTDSIGDAAESGRHSDQQIHSKNADVGKI
jgi:hypothetical protein